MAVIPFVIEQPAEGIEIPTGVRIVKWTLDTGDTGTPYVCPHYADKCVQVTGTFAATTVTIEGSNEIIATPTLWNTLHDPSDNALPVAHRLIPQGNGGTVRQSQAAELLAKALLLLLHERLAPDEVAFVQLDREAQAGFKGGVVGADVRAPVAIPLLQPECVNRSVAGCNQPVVLPSLPERVPQLLAVLHGAIELPAQLAYVGDANR